jgi:hypothetical protein
MSGMQPRSFDDHARLFALAHMQGYPVALAWNENGRRARPARARRRSALGHVRSAFARPAVPVAEPQPCAS